MSDEGHTKESHLDVELALKCVHIVWIVIQFFYSDDLLLVVGLPRGMQFAHTLMLLFWV